MIHKYRRNDGPGGAGGAGCRGTHCPSGSLQQKIHKNKSPPSTPFLAPDPSNTCGPSDLYQPGAGLGTIFARVF
jgi:hypothetical protein